MFASYALLIRGWGKCLCTRRQTLLVKARFYRWQIGSKMMRNGFNLLPLEDLFSRFIDLFQDR